MNNRVFNKITAPVFVALGALLFNMPAAQAQLTSVGRVLGTEISGDRCTITLADEDDQIITQTTDAQTCQQTLVGNRIQLIYDVARINVLIPPQGATINKLVAGDRACYVELTDTDGNALTQFATFEICEQDLVGARVELTYETGNILGYACGGNVDCGKSEAATLISSVEIIEGPPAPTSTFISDLPDGNYRFWNGEPTDGIVTDDDLLASGERTLIVRFRKQGNNFTGIFGYVSDNAICVQGQINEDTVTGISVQSGPEFRPISTGETFESFNASDRLKIRRGRQVSSRRQVINGTAYTINTVRYASTILDLSGLNQINAGTRVPPQRC